MEEEKKELSNYYLTIIKEGEEDKISPEESMKTAEITKETAEFILGCFTLKKMLYEDSFKISFFDDTVDINSENAVLRYFPEVKLSGIELNLGEHEGLLNTKTKCINIKLQVEVDVSDRIDKKQKGDANATNRIRKTKKD